MVKKPTDPDLEDEGLEDEDESEDEEELVSGDEDEEVDEQELDAQIKGMVQEFLQIPEVKGLVGEIARDAARRAADTVRNEYANKLTKDFGTKFDSMAERFDTLEKAVGIEHAEAEALAGGEGETAPDVIKKRIAALQKKERELAEKEKTVEEREKGARVAELEAYKKSVVREFGLTRVSHLVHGDDEDSIDDSVVEARKALNSMRRDFVKEFREKGWTPPAEELGEEGESDKVDTAEAKSLRQRFNYGSGATPITGATIAP